MAKFDDHPTVKRWREQLANTRSTDTVTLNIGSLRTLCLDLGADDVGFVEIDRPAIVAQHSDILGAFPPTKTLISFVCRMNEDDVRTPARSIANLEFHANYDHANEVARNIVKALAQIGVRAVNPASAFPMEMDRFPGKVWVVSHKPVAVAAGLGHMGIHRNVIHPKFGNFMVKPLQDKPETIYVIPGSDAETYVAKRFPHKKVKLVSSGIRPQSIQGFVFGLPLLFQQQQSTGLNAIYHFTFTGSESCCVTVVIRDRTLQVESGHIGKADLSVKADSQTWLGFLAKEQNIIWALVRRKIQIRGSLKLLQAFGKCFPA